MGDMREVFDAVKEHHKERKARNLKAALEKVYSLGGWEIHTEWHWSRSLNGKRLDFWPSRNKFQYEGKVMCGDVVGFIRNRENAPRQSTFADKYDWKYSADNPIPTQEE